MFKYNANNGIIVNKYYKKTLCYCGLVALNTAIYLTFMEMHPNIKYNYVNVISYLLALLMFFEGCSDIGKHGISLFNVFVITFFFALMINNFNISNLQVEKELSDIYFFFSGPLIFAGILWLGDHFLLIKKYKAPFIVDYDVLSLMLLCGYAFVQMYVYSNTGIRFFSNEWGGVFSSNFVVPGVSGINTVLMWLNLMMLPYVRKSYLKIFISLFPIVCTVFNAKRGDTIRVIGFLFIVYALSYGGKLVNKKNIIALIIVFFIGSNVFSFMGNYRHIKSGGRPDWSITRAVESEIDNEAINWLFAYTGMNFDVLKVFYIENEPIGEIRSLLMPLERVIGGNEAVVEYEQMLYIDGLNGFNASTFLSRFVRELGVAYIFNVFLLGIIVAVMGYVCRVLKYTGGYAMLCMLTVLTFFGNYYCNFAYFFSIIIGMGVVCLVGEKGK